MRAALWPSACHEDHFAELGEFFAKSSFQGWIARENEMTIGFAEASIRAFASGWDSQPVAFVEGLRVVDSFRRKNVSRFLIEAIEGWAKSQGLFELGFDDLLENTLSHECHKKWGFEERKRVVCYRKQLV